MSEQIDLVQRLRDMATGSGLEPEDVVTLRDAEYAIQSWLKEEAIWKDEEARLAQENERLKREVEYLTDASVEAHVKAAADRGYDKLCAVAAANLARAERAEAERETIAKMVEDFRLPDAYSQDCMDYLAAQIRALGAQQEKEQ